MFAAWVGQRQRVSSDDPLCTEREFARCAQAYPRREGQGPLALRVRLKAVESAQMPLGTLEQAASFGGVFTGLAPARCIATTRKPLTTALKQMKCGKAKDTAGDSKEVGAAVVKVESDVAAEAATA